MEVLKAVMDAIKELGSVPSGHLYARLMEYIPLTAYESIIRTLEKNKYIQVKNHLITYYLD